MIFIEDSAFTKARETLLSDDDFYALQNWLLVSPESGAVIQRSGGCRKIRWAAKGHGKRGGVRVIYFYRLSAAEILLLEIYPKNEKEDLTAEDLKRLKRKINP
ncbi:MAG: type II toxin-antitoxin system RelE/ParE family toxin [Opitutus sp.]|nr:type II toxin-antitoxin system RelE/ParE family toxin [Opitutus sp.]